MFSILALAFCFGVPRFKWVWHCRCGPVLDRSNASRTTRRSQRKRYGAIGDGLFNVPRTQTLLCQVR